MKISKIDSDLTIYKDNAVIIWGASGGGKRIYKLLRAYQIDVVYFCDMASDKWGTEYCDVEVISPEDLKRFYLSKPCVVQIASSWEKEIEEELQRKGIDNYIRYSEALMRLLNLKKYYASLENPAVFRHFCEKDYHSRKVRDHIAAWHSLMSPFFDTQDEVILLCMPTKTGNWTLVTTMDSLDLCYTNFWHKPYNFTKEMQDYIGNRKIKLITATRDIIDQNISHMFDWINMGAYWGYDEFWKDGGDVSALFLRQVKVMLDEERGMMQVFLNKWFKNFMGTGINLYEHSFDKERGYSIIKQGNIEIFVYQLEKLNEIYHSLFDFLGVSVEKLVIENTVEQKWCFPLYEKVRKGMEIEREYFESCYNSESFHHFYSESDIEKFRNKWINNVRG